MTSTRAKTRNQQNVATTSPEDDMRSSKFSEPGLWEPSVALLVGETHKSNFFIDQLKKTVNKGTRPLFTFLDASEIIVDAKVPEEPKAVGKNKDKAGEKSQNKSRGKSPQQQKVSQDEGNLSAFGGHFDGGKDFLGGEESLELEWSLPLQTVALMIKKKLMELKAVDRNEEVGQVSVYREDTDDKSKSQKGGKKSGAKQTSRGKGKPELEEKKDAKEDEEAGKMKDNNLIKDEPKDGPNRYFLLSGFHHPHLATHLSNVGIAINAIFKVTVRARALCYLKKKTERRMKEEQKETGDGDQVALDKDHQMDNKLMTFWKDVFLLLDKQPTGSSAQDVVTFELCVDDFLLDGEKDPDVNPKPCDEEGGESKEEGKEDKDGDRENVDTPGDDDVEIRRLELLGVCMFDRVARSLYDLVTLRRHWKFYRDALQVTVLPEGIPKDKEGALKSVEDAEEASMTSARPRYLDSSYYKAMMDTLTPDMTSIPLIMYCIREQVCHWEEELQEKIFPEHEITLSDRLATKELEIVEMDAIHNFNNCSNNNNNNNKSSNNINNKNNSAICDSLLNLTNECQGEDDGSAVQRIIDHMGKVVLQLALSDEEKQKLKRLFNQPPDPPKKDPPCPDPPQVIGYHDEASKRLADPQKGRCFPLAFDPLKAELEMLGLTKSADLIRLADLCSNEPDLIATRSDREMRMEQLLCFFNLQCPRINKTELDHYLTLLVIECLSLKNTDCRGVVIDDGSVLIPIIEPLIWDDPFQSVLTFDSEMSVTNTISGEAELICQSLGEKLRCSQKRILDDFCYEEAFDAQSLLQRMHGLFDTHPFVEAYMRRTDGSLVVILHDPFDQKTRTRNGIWRAQAFSDCGLRNFLQFFRERLSTWLDMREMKHQVQKLEAESSRMDRELQEAADAMEKCKMPLVPEDFFVRNGSIKASVLEKQKKEVEVKDLEKLPKDASDNRDSSSGKTKTSGKESKAKPGKASGADQSRDSKSKTLDDSRGSKVKKDSRSSKGEGSQPREPKICCFLGYDVGDDMVSMVGRHASMHTTDGGVVEAERIVVGQGRCLCRTTLKKDGHFFTIHTINPSPLKGDQRGCKSKCFDIPDRPIRNDDKGDGNKGCGKPEAADDDTGAAGECENISNNAKSTDPPRSASLPSPDRPNVRPSENEPQNEEETLDPREMAVGEFASFVGLLDNGLGLSYSVFGNDGEPLGGKPYEPAAYVPPATKTLETLEEEKSSRNSKTQKASKFSKSSKNKKPAPAEDESSRPQEVPVEHEDEERSEVKEEVEEEITQKFNQVFVCRRDGLQVTFMLESALAGPRTDDACSRNVLTKMRRTIPPGGANEGGGGGDVGGDPCCRSLDFSDEKARYVTCDGNVVVATWDGKIKVLFADGMVKELRSFSTACLRQPSLQDPPLEPSRSEDSKTSKHLDKGPPKKAKKGDADKIEESAPEPDDDPVAEAVACPPTSLCWMTTCPTGERYIQRMDGQLIHLKPLRVYTVTDPQTKEVMTSREDRTLTVLKPSGVLVVEHSDCTRITTLQSLPQDSTCMKFDKSVKTCFTVECPSYPTVSSDSVVVTVMFDVEKCKLECFSSGAYKLFLEDCSMLCIDEGGTATYLGREVVDAIEALPDAKGPGFSEKRSADGSTRTSSLSTKADDVEIPIKIESKTSTRSEAADDILKFLKHVEGQKVAGVYSMKHGEDTVLETVDSTGRRYMTNKKGEASVCFVEDFIKTIPVTNLMDEDLKIFNILGSRKAIEFLRSNEAEDQLKKLKKDPEANLIVDKLFDGCPETNAFGISSTRNFRRTVQSKTRKPGCGHKTQIIPKGLRSRNFANFPPKEEKKPGKSFGHDAGVGLDVKSWDRCGEEEVRPVVEKVEEELECGCNVCRKEKKEDDCKKRVLMVEKRKFFQFPALEKELRERMEQAVKCLFEERLRQTRHLKEMEVVDPRTDEEKERAEELRKRVLCMIATAGRLPPPVATNVIAQDEEPDEKVDVEPPAGHSGSPPLPDPCDFLRQNPEASCDNIGETVNDQNGDAYGDRDSGDAYGDRDSGDAYGDRDSGNGYGSGNFGDAHGNENSGDESGNGYGDHVEEEGADNDHENACPGEETPTHHPEILSRCCPSNCCVNNLNNSNVQCSNDNNNKSNLSNSMDVSNVKTKQIISGRRPRNSDLVSNAEAARSLSDESRAGTLALVTPALNFGKVKDGEVFSYMLQIKNSGLDPKKFRIRLPPPKTGLRVLYQAVPIPAGLRCNIEIQLYASTMSSSSSSSSQSSVKYSNGTAKGGHKLRHDLEIATEEGRLKFPITALILPSSHKKEDENDPGDDGEDEEEEEEEMAMMMMRTPGVRKIIQKLPAGTELFRTWKAMKQTMKAGT